MYIYNPSSLAVQLHLQHLYCPRVHLGWTQTAPLGAFMPTTMWLSWHFVCDWPPQPYSTAAIFSGLGPAAKTLGRKKRDVKKKKTRDVIDGSLWSYFLPPQNGWLPTTYGCLSNWGIIVPSVHTWQETYALTVLLGRIYNALSQKTKCFSVFKEADVIILQCLLRFFFLLCIASAKGKPYIALFSQPAPEHTKNVHNIFATVKQQCNSARLKMEKYTV